MIHLKNIHIGSLIQKKVKELDISMNRICKFFNDDELGINEMYIKNSLNSDDLLKWSKLLEYDFFRIYSQHLVFYSHSIRPHCALQEITSLPLFRKNIYTKEMIDFIVDLVDTRQKTKNQIIKEYGIPKTTLYKWIVNYKSSKAN